MERTEEEMTIPIETTKVQYAGSGTKGPFSFSFKVFAAEDVQCIKQKEKGETHSTTKICLERAEKEIATRNP
jgi:hypothetical protein